MVGRNGGTRNPQLRTRNPEHVTRNSAETGNPYKITLTLNTTTDAGGTDREVDACLPQDNPRRVVPPGAHSPATPLPCIELFRSSHLRVVLIAKILGTCSTLPERGPPSPSAAPCPRSTTTCARPPQPCSSRLYLSSPAGQSLPGPP